MKPDNSPAATSNSGAMEPPYPGFGQRHDIFYQYQGSVQPSAIPRSMPLPAPAPTPAQAPPEQYYYPQSGGHKGLIISFTVLLTLAVAGGLYFFFTHHSKTPAAGGANQQATNQNPDLVNTPCFSFTLPQPHAKLSASSSNCSGTYHSGSDNVAGVTVTPLIYPHSTIDELVAGWKTNNPNNTVSAENPAAFGQYSAEQLFWTSSAISNVAQMTVLTYVPTNGLQIKYTENGAPVTGFQIDGRYDSQSNSKTVYDSILSSWAWK